MGLCRSWILTFYFAVGSWVSWIPIFGCGTCLAVKTLVLKSSLWQVLPLSIGQSLHILLAIKFEMLVRSHKIFTRGFCTALMLILQMYSPYFIDD